MIRHAILAAAATLLLLPAAATAAPDTVIDFESISPGTQIDDDYAAAGVLFGKAQDFGLPPAARECPLPRAVAIGISGTSAKIGCVGGKEFSDRSFNTAFEFSTERRAVRFKLSQRVADVARSADVRVYAIAGVLLEQRTVSLARNAVVDVEFTRARSEIAAVVISGVLDLQSLDDVLLDDIVASLDDQPPPPKFSLALGNPSIELVEGSTAAAMLSIRRFNGSTGPVDVSVGELPAGVIAAQVDPNPVTGRNPAALRISADSPFAGQRQLTVTARGGVAAGTPIGAQAVQTVTGIPAVQIPGGRSPIRLVPGCGPQPVDDGFSVRGDFRRHISVYAFAKPGGLTASAEPSNITATGNGFYPVKLSLDPGGADGGGQFEFGVLPSFATPASVRLDWLTDRVRVDRVEPASIGRPLVRGAATVTAIGNFPLRCAVTFRDDAKQTWDVRSRDAVDLDGRRLDRIVLEVPLRAASGQLKVLSPAGAELASTRVEVTDWRNTHGFRFRNYPGFRVNFDLMKQVFGDQVNLRVNACGLSFGLVDCSITTPFPSPATLTWMLALNGLFGGNRLDDAHCFGMSLTALKLRIGRLSRTSFSPAGAASTFALDGAERPVAPLSEEINRNHLRQFSRDVAGLVFRPLLTTASMRNAVRAELARGRPPMVSIRKGTFGGHVVVIHGVTDRPDGGIDLHVYDPNLPVAQRPITVRDDRWDYPELPGYSGAMDKIFLVPVDAVPDRPAFISSLNDVIALVSGSLEGIRDQHGKPVKVRTVPILEQGVDNGFAVLPAGGRYTFRSRPRNGPYEMTVQGAGVVARVVGIRPAPGTASVAKLDELTFDTKKHTLSLDPAAGPSPLDATLTARAAGRSSRTARVQLSRNAGSQITFSGSAVRVRHKGSAATLQLELSEVGGRSLPDSFRGPAVRIARGQTVELKPDNWTAPRNVSLRVTAGPGKGRRRTLRDVSRATAPVRLGKIAVRPMRRGRAGVTLPVRFGSLAEGTTASVMLLVRRGRKIVARNAIQVTAPPSGQWRTFSLTARGLKPGRHRVEAAVVLVTQSRAGLLDSAIKRKAASFSGLP